ncbi:restriction endonuclease subunit S [Ferviditalea candida]|uniref:Restriction endonuclease subunit S n=1 Tax=Ferviditalea candida TaxID=3108399 RepID=A0ABU5ZMA8_9BACL|nr:restriction endonuclease subunit S [Paenibacillaceae bacterium T2]
MRLGEVCESVSLTFRKQQDRVILINTSDVLDGKVTNHEYVPNENLRGQFKKSFRRDDILYSEIRPKNRRFAYVDFESDDYVASTKLMVIRANDKVLPQFLFQVLKSDEIIEQLQLLAETRSGTFPQITFSELAALDVRIPPIPEQREIAATMNAIDDKIANNTKINHHLEQIAQAIFKSWFVDFEPWDGKMPEGWTLTTLNALCSMVAKGITPQYDENSPEIVINQKCIRNKTIDLSLVRRHQPKRVNEKWLQYGDILINSTGEGTLGRAAQFFLSASNYTVDSHITIVRPIKEDLVFFLGQWCLQRESEFAAMASGSTGQTDLPRERLKAMDCMLPDVHTLQRFSQLLKPVVEKQVAVRTENAHLAVLRDMLLPRLMSGELLVSDLSDAK